MRIGFLGNFMFAHCSETHHANSLESLGHQVIRLQERQTSPQRLLHLGFDLFVWVHTHGWHTHGIDAVINTFKQRGIPVITYHLDFYMGIPDRWRQYRSDSYMLSLDHFFTVDRLMADWLNEHTQVKGHFLPAGVYDKECYISDQPSPHANDVVFVGSRGYHPEWPYRPQLIDWLRDTYGPRFTHVGPGTPVGILRGDDLNRLYAGSKVAVGDSLCPNFDYPSYCSDRLFECAGRGGAQVFPRIKGIDEWFTENKEILFYEYGNFTDLRMKIDWLINHSAEREQMRQAGHQRAKAEHTYRHRWETILGTVFR